MRRPQVSRALLVVLAPVAIAVAAPCWPAGPENPQKPYSLNIARKAMTPALQDFSTQTGLNVGFFPQDEAEENVEVGPVQGSFTADAGLEALLEGSEFAHEWLNGKSIYVFKKPQQNTSTNTLKKREANASSRTIRRPGGRSDYDDIDFVIVIGTRISSLITEPQSVAVMNQQRIDSYGVSTLSELFDYLPQIPFIKAEHARATGEQFADLRGFGPGTTMILLNGRRIAGTATSFDTGGFDVNTIPLTAVQRIEVLLDAPSVAIGTDTIAGVINVVLKEEIPQPIVEVRYGAADGGAEERRLSAGIGASSENFRATATFDVFQRNALMGAEREPIRNQDFRRFGGTDYRSINANPGNISSGTSANLPGLNSPFAAVPVGSSGIDLTPQDFTSTTGLLNRNRTSLGRFLSIVPEVSRLSLITSAELKLSASLTSFAEIFASNRKSERQNGPPTLSSTQVPASNAFNPFDVPVTVTTFLEGAPMQAWTTDAKLIRAVAGIRGEWNEWEGEIAATWMKDRASFSRENELNFSSVAQALASSDPAAALNVFRDGPAGTKALLESLVAPPQTRRYSSTVAQGYARAEGPLLAMPAGALRLMFGGEWREDEVANDSLPTSPHRTVAAGFAEIHAPLISEEMHIPAIQHLAISVGARSDHYADFGSHTTPQYGLVWRPSASLKFRASYSESYRAPLLYELYAPGFSAPVTFPDPKRGRQLSTFVFTYAGNSDLAPTVGNTWTTGIDFTPQALPQLQMSIGYWRTALAERIVPLNVLELIANEALYPGRVIRAPPSPQEVESGIAGAIEMADVSWGNFGQLSAAGFDLTLAFTWDTSFGQFTSNLSGVWNDEFKTAVVAGAPAVDRIGIARAEGTIPRWRAIASTAWARGPFGAFVAAQIVSAYDDAFIDGTATGRTIPVTLVFDAQASLRVGELLPTTSLLSEVELTVGAKNMFDKKPHFAEAGWEYGYDLTQVDLTQRFWYLRLAKAF